MFHDSSKEIKVIPEENSILPVQINDSNKEEMYKKHIKATTNSYCPVIFIDDEEVADYHSANTTTAEISATITNISAAYNINLPSYPYNYLYSLRNTSEYLLEEILTERIKEESLMTIMSVMDNIDAITNRMFLRFFDIRECIAESLRSELYIKTIIGNMLRSGVLTTTKMEEQDFEQTKKMLDMYIQNIYTILIHTVTVGVNKSIDDTLLRIHIIPNIAELKDMIIKNYNVPKEDQNEKKFWIFANMSLKDGISTAFNEVAYPVIYENIKNIIQTTVATSFYVYGDAIADKRANDKKNNKSHYPDEDDLNF